MSLEVDKVGAATRLDWNAGTQGHTSNVYRGTLGRPWTYDEVCFAAEVTVDFHEDTEVLAQGTGTYYLVSSRNSCGDSRAGPAPDGAPARPV